PCGSPPRVVPQFENLRGTALAPAGLLWPLDGGGADAAALRAHGGARGTPPAVQGPRGPAFTRPRPSSVRRPPAAPTLPSAGSAPGPRIPGAGSLASPPH